jgi:hypothetical protein
MPIIIITALSLFLIREKSGIGNTPIIITALSLFLIRE